MLEENKNIKNHLSSWFLKHPKYYIGNKLSTHSIYRAITGCFRLLPDFIIIGSIASGTTSLYNYLLIHPQVAPSFRKEIYFFDLNYYKGVNWYKAHFPFSWKKRNFITGEATATYLRHPLALKRIAETIPHVKMIILLRNPVDRAYAFYHSRRSHGDETLSFDQAIKFEEKRLEGEIDKILNDDRYFPYNYYTYGYLSGGIYVEQLKRWMNVFPKEQFLILQSEHFFIDPAKILKSVTEFLNLPSFKLKEYKQYNPHDYPKMESTLHKKLSDYFKPYNDKLSEFLNMEFDWKN